MRRQLRSAKLSPSEYSAAPASPRTLNTEATHSARSAVEMDKCRSSGALTSANEDMGKIKRYTKTGIEFFRKQQR